MELVGLALRLILTLVNAQAFSSQSLLLVRSKPMKYDFVSNDTVNDVPN